MLRESIVGNRSAPNTACWAGTISAIRFAGSHLAVEVTLVDGATLQVHSALGTPGAPGQAVSVFAADDAAITVVGR
ncbi:TOBE domain-containing protein [Nakamurella antarctica]|uniref:TOBE domain-containing protein n=1 Tax=Nakamurella antarctica TaxID=1902245 RepID=UPI003BB08BCB